MFHREIAEEITRALSARFDGTAFSILEGLAVYKGVDLSHRPGARRLGHIVRGR